MTSPSIWCSQSTPRTALQFEFIEWPSTWQSTNPTTTRDGQSCPLHRLCLLFFTQESLFRLSGTPWIFLTTLCLVLSGFLANLFLISFCIQNRLRGNHWLRSPSFCTVCTVCPSRKWRRGYEEAKREKKVEKWTGSKLRSWSWSFVPAATCACLQPLTKHWSIYAKPATIVSPV